MRTGQKLLQRKKNALRQLLCCIKTDESSHINKEKLSVLLSWMEKNELLHLHHHGKWAVIQMTMNKKQRYELIGSRIREIRKARNLTQERFGEMTNTSLTTISRLELGKQMVSVNTLFLIAEQLSVGIDDILQDFMKPKPKSDEVDGEVYLMWENMSPEEKEYTKKQMQLFCEYNKKVKDAKEKKTEK